MLQPTEALPALLRANNKNIEFSIGDVEMRIGSAEIRIGIRGKLVATLIIAGVLPVLITISITYFVEISQRRSTVGESFQRLSEEARDNILLRLIASIRVIKDLSELPVTIDFLHSASLISSISPKLVEWRIADIDKRWSELDEDDEVLDEIMWNQLVETFNSVGSSFGEIFATDTFGRVVAATNKTTDYGQADEEWWQKTYNNGYGQLYLSEVTFDESVGVYSINICVPVWHVEKGERRIVGIIKGVLAAPYVFESISYVNIVEGGKGVVISYDRTVVVSTDPALLRQQLPPEVCPVTSLGGSDWYVAPAQSWEKTLVGFARIELNESGLSRSTPWSVIIYQELSGVYAPARRLMWYTALSGASLILVFLFLGLFIMERKIASPLSLLTQTVKRVASGELMRTVEIDSKDEIGELTSSFNQMVSNLEKRISLDDMSLNMLSHLELSDVLSVTMDTLRTTFDAALARLWLVGDGDLCDDCVHADICLNKERCLHLKITVGIYAKDEEYLWVPLGALRVGRIAEIGRPYMTNDLTTDEWIHNATWLQQRLIVSFAGYPLLSGGELLGALVLFRRSSISNEEFIILGSFADRATMAIQNARLHSEVTDLNLNLEQMVEERTDELKLANVKLRRADQLKSEFLANMSHELRTPLNAIIGFSEVLRDGLCGELNEEQKESVIDIHGSGRHLLEMINDVLDLSKIEAGKMELQPEEFSVAAAMNGILSIVREMANKKQLGLETKIPENLPVIYADHVKFKQIMYNLLSNAVKFTPEGGTVTVGVRLNDDEFLISITDTGIGIDPKDHEVIFDEFRQVDSSLSRQYEGTGLGLSLTKRLVELHGGIIWVESEGDGTGAKFSFTLPVGKSDAGTDEAPAFLETAGTFQRQSSISYEEDVEQRNRESNTDLSIKTILVVEDALQASQLLCIYLKEAGYNTVLAVDGDEAVKMAREIKPFAITLDIMLPKKDGWQVMQELKNFEDTRDIPVIIVSIVDDESFGFSMGAVGYLVKPIDKEQLIHALEKLEFEDTPPRILIIDDNLEDLKMMEAILNSEQFEVLTASSGVRGVAKAIQERPNLIILDLLMPVMSGFGVVKALQEHPEARNIPIIICTMKELTVEDKETLNNKVKSIVQKGEDAKLHLMEAVRRIEHFHVESSG